MNAMKRGGPRVLAVLFGVLLAAGCATGGDKRISVRDAIADRVDIGDGEVMDAVPASTVIGAIDKAVPGSGTALTAAEENLKSRREAKFGPFGGLPYTIRPYAITKDGTVLTEKDLAEVGEIYVPVVPEPVVRVKKFGEAVTGAVVDQPVTPISQSKSSKELLEKIGGAK